MTDSEQSNSERVQLGSSWRQGEVGGVVVGISRAQNPDDDVITLLCGGRTPIQLRASDLRAGCEECQSDIPRTPREVAEELVDEATGSRGVYHGVPLSRLRQWATFRGVDIDETRDALADVKAERGIG